MKISALCLYPWFFTAQKEDVKAHFIHLHTDFYTSVHRLLTISNIQNADYFPVSLTALVLHNS